MPWLCPLSLIHPQLANSVDEEDRRGEGEEGCQEHEERKYERTVDQQQDDEDRPDRDQQEDAVDPSERVDEVGCEARRPRDPALRIRREIAVDDRPQVGDDRLHAVGVLDRHDELDSATVLRRDRSRDRRRGGAGRLLNAIDRAQLLAQFRVSREFARRDRGTRFDHDDRGDGVRVRELLLPVADFGGLCAGWQE